MNKDEKNFFISTMISNPRYMPKIVVYTLVSWEKNIGRLQFKEGMVTQGVPVLKKEEEEEKKKRRDKEKEEGRRKKKDAAATVRRRIGKKG